MLTSKSYAKINLFLQILNKRPDGFHDLNTLFAKINLFDEINITASNKFSIETNKPEIPSGESNIIYKVKNILEKEYGLKCPVKVYLKKNIPVGGGLGGGSGNAATFLNAIDSFCNFSLDFETKKHILSKVGSDTVFFLYDKPMIGTSRGEILTPAPDIPKLNLLIVNPNIFVSTKEIFQDKNLRLTPKKEVIRMRQPSGLEDLCRIMRNDLELPVFLKFPKIKKLKEIMEEAGAIKAMMSGSGSTVFGVFNSCENALNAGEIFIKKFPKYFVKTVTTL